MKTIHCVQVRTRGSLDRMELWTSQVSAELRRESINARHGEETGAFIVEQIIEDAEEITVQNGKLIYPHLEFIEKDKSAYRFLIFLSKEHWIQGNLEVVSRIDPWEDIKREYFWGKTLEAEGENEINHDFTPSQWSFDRVKEMIISAIDSGFCQQLADYETSLYEPNQDY